MKYFNLMRIHHYIKNLLIMLPVFFGRQLFNTELLIKTLFAFLAFSFISSVVYIINDIMDAEQDKKHSTKYERPIACGKIHKKQALVIAFLLFIVSLFFNYLSCGGCFLAWVYISTYFLLNFCYSMGLKNIPILDIAILASGFLLRVLYGSAVTGIEISSWLYLTVISASFYLGLGKRRNELLKQNADSRKVLCYYNHNFLDKNMYMFLALTIAFYSLWSVDPVTIERVSSGNLVFTVPLLIIIFLKYNLKLEHESDGDPIEVVLRDKMLIVLIGIFALCSVLFVYL